MINYAISTVLDGARALHARGVDDGVLVREYLGEGPRLGNLRLLDENVSAPAPGRVLDAGLAAARHEEEGRALLVAHELERRAELRLARVCTRAFADLRASDLYCSDQRPLKTSEAFPS